MRDEVAETVRAACRALAGGRLEDTLELLASWRDMENPARRSLELAARGLRAEREGDAAAAAACFERVFGEGVPLPDVLRATGRYFARSGDAGRADHCSRLADGLLREGAAMPSLDAPDAELARFAPLFVKPMARRQRAAFYSLAFVKNALISQLGGHAAAVVYGQLLDRGRGWSVADLRLTPLPTYARSHALLFEEIAPARAVSLLPPPVFGAQPAEALESRTRSFYVCVLADAVVQSKSNFVLTQSDALLDVEPDELSMFPRALEVDPPVIQVEDGSVKMVVDRPLEPSLEEAFSLVGVHSYAFGHWLLEFLPRLLAMRGREEFSGLPILVDEQMRPQHREALEFFVGPDHPVVVVPAGGAVRVRRLWTASMLSGWLQLSAPEGYREPTPIPPVDGEAFARLLTTVRPLLAAAASPGGPRRILITRKDSQHRRLVNRLAVEEWFAARGFVIVDFADLPFIEQIRLIQGADVIVGPDGSGMWMGFFARPGTRIGYLNNPWLDEHWFVAQLCSDLGLPLLILVGDVVEEDPRWEKFSSYEVDMAKLPGFLDELLSRPA